LCKSYVTKSAPGYVCHVLYSLFECKKKFYVCALVGVLIK